MLLLLLRLAGWFDVVLGSLSRQRPAQLHHACLGGIVTRLLLWVVDNATAHAGNKHNGCRPPSSDGGAPYGMRHEERPSGRAFSRTCQRGTIVQGNGNAYL